MTRHNAGALQRIHDLARREGLQFTFTVAHSSPVFFGDKRGEEPEAARALPDLEAMKSRLFASGNPKDWFKAYFVGGLVDMVRGRPRLIKCRAGLDFFYLDAEGNVYPCHLWDRPLGNILETTYEEMVRTSREVLASVRTCGRRCWMTCTVAPEMRRRLPVFAVRVGWAKARHHLREVARPK
jgi:MoaA/NifB/PqqE/SkfB family radical SAM enzyme